MLTRKSSFVPALCLVTLLGLASLAGATNEVFLSTDTAESEVTYVIQFESGVKGNIDKIRITLPPGTNAANARLGRLLIGDKDFEGDDEHKKDATLSVDPLDPNTLIVDLRDARNVKVGTKILVELFNLNNPVAGDHVIDVTTIDRRGNTLDMIMVAYSVFATVVAEGSPKFNTALGASALSSNTTGSFNTALGANALFSNTTASNNTASGVSALQNNTTGNDNTASGRSALLLNTTGNQNTASGHIALTSNTTGEANTASGRGALSNNTTGNNNTAIGSSANVSAGNLDNATAIGNGAIVNASNKIRLGNAAVTVIEGQVAFTASSDKTRKENFKPVNEDEVLKKVGQIPVQSWNYIGHDPKKLRHYGPMAQDFFAAFGNDGVGTIGTPTTINSGDMAGILMIAVQALEKQNRDLKARVEDLERLVKERPYLTATAEPILSKVEGPVQ